MPSLVVRDIGELLTMVPGDGGGPLGLVRGAAVVISDGRVDWVGPETELKRASLPSDREEIEAHGALVTPGLCDPHTHPIFAGSRAAEFDQRAQGQSYAEIQKAGGGILATVKATVEASDDELIAGTRGRLDRLLAQGVTCCEGKSGYALDLDGELRLLTLLREAASDHPVTLSPTLLAHVPPPDLSAADRADHVARFAKELVPRAARLGLCEALDVYCDEGAFTLDETRAILEAGKAAELLLRVHAEQFTHTGAAKLAAELGARTVEHLEKLDAETIPLLAKAGTVCVLLPGAALTLRLPFPDARRLIAGGCTIALGTDLNPGSCYTESLPLMMSLACMQMGLSVAEAWQAVTVHAARAIGRERDAGRIAVGRSAELVLWDATDHREAVQHFGVPLVRTVVAAGRVVYQR